jgi:CubicO group peptidase (beta-lactamase class C family)
MTFRTCRRAATVAVAIALLAARFAAAQVAAVAEEPRSTESLAAEIERMLVEAYPDAEGPGAALLVVRQGEVLYRGARGMANLELGVPLSADHVFRLGSITKQFTAAAILLLEERGKLTVDDPITEYLPDFPTHGHEITIAHLLTHTSGIYNLTDIPGYMDQPVRQDVTTEELIDAFRDLDPEFEPGERWDYSNSGYILLGAIIEKVSGQSYAEFMRENVFEPLGLHHTDCDGTRIIPNRASGYELAGDGYANAAFISMTQPHGAGVLVSTVDDLVRWNAALAGGELISKESYERMTRPAVLDDGTEAPYGYGFSVGDVRSLPAVHHGGGIHGFVTFALYLPGEDVYVAALSNLPGGGMGPGPLALRAGALVAGDPFPDHERAAIDPTILERYVGVYRIGHTATRTVTLEGGKLYTQRSGGLKVEAIPHSETGFFYEQSLTPGEMVLDDSGAVSHMLMYHDGASEPERAERTDEEVVVPPTEEADVDPAIYDRYDGRYQLAPGFVLTVTREGDRLFAQATGQPRFEIFPSSETEFFVKLVDARLVFEVGVEGPAASVTLHQAGQVVPGPRLDD